MADLEKFEIVCRKCKPKGSQTHLHLELKKGWYALICLDCGATEVFDLEGNAINLQEKK
uniref:Uncharacterized protein n=1 Tax=viral metagenome TaxID=1070528 RepID=A0A6H2A2E8_9ZZZZ